MQISPRSPGGTSRAGSATSTSLITACGTGNRHEPARRFLPDEAGLARSLGLTCVHIPVQFGAPAEADLMRFFDAMDRHRGQKLLVHCAANKRVTVFIGLYRVLRLQWDREQAFALMHEIWEPDATWTAFIEAMLAKRR
jgi:protein tyrosine phosphatase (PTP) superfamily phosphohydrolase (DUF442 family)